jgi:hypothetical protein
MPSASQFDLSFCIPTYNRIASLLPLVRKILACDSPRIEVVVLDNASTDSTLQALRSISDSRLKVHANGVNRGVLFNILHVLDKAQGRHAVLLLDKDDVDPAAIPGFQAFLAREPGLACGYCEYGSDLPEEAVVFDHGMPALRRIAYSGHHPTGYFFDTARLRAVDYLARFSDFDVVGHFPFDFIFAELLIQGRGAIYHRRLFTPEPEAKAAQHKSIGTNAAREDAFFSPPGRLKTAVGFARHIGSLPLRAEEKKALVVDRFLQGLVASTVDYRALMSNAALCAHYHIATRRIGLPELAATAFSFHRGFVGQAVSGATTGDARLPKLKFHLAVVQRLVQALARRLGRRAVHRA